MVVTVAQARGACQIACPCYVSQNVKAPRTVKTVTGQTQVSLSMACGVAPCLDAVQITSAAHQQAGLAWMIQTLGQDPKLSPAAVHELAANHPTANQQIDADASEAAGFASEAAAVNQVEIVEGLSGFETAMVVAQLAAVTAQTVGYVTDPGAAHTSAAELVAWPDWLGKGPAGRALALVAAGRCPALLASVAAAAAARVAIAAVVAAAAVVASAAAAAAAAAPLTAVATPLIADALQQAAAAAAVDLV